MVDPEPACCELSLAQLGRAAARVCDKHLFVREVLDDTQKGQRALRRARNDRRNKPELCQGLQKLRRVLGIACSARERAGAGRGAHRAGFIHIALDAGKDALDSGRGEPSCLCRALSHVADRRDLPELDKRAPLLLFGDGKTRRYRADIDDCNPCHAYSSNLYWKRPSRNFVRLSVSAVAVLVPEIVSDVESEPSEESSVTSDPSPVIVTGVSPSST